MAGREGRGFQFTHEIRAPTHHHHHHHHQQLEEDQIPNFTGELDDYNDDELLMESFSSRSRRRHFCCYSLFPCFGSRTTPGRGRARTLLGSSYSSSSDWDKLQSTAEINSKHKWWVRPLSKIRQWSESVAGPKWKPFSRRFKRNACGDGGGGRSGGGAGKFQYDPLSYSLNFDEGQGWNGHFSEKYGYFSDFSSRFAVNPRPYRST